MSPSTDTHDSKAKLISAALNVVRAKGFTATRVEDICAAAGLTKGSFFHHFKSKEDLALAAAQAWGEGAQALFADAPYTALADPRARLLGYIDFRKELLQGGFSDFTCFAGTTVQEVYDTHPAISDAVAKTISDHIAVLEPDVAEAMRVYGSDGTFSARSLTRYLQVVLQGAFVLAKAERNVDAAVESLDLLKQHIELLFDPHHRGAKPAAPR